MEIIRVRAKIIGMEKRVDIRHTAWSNLSHSSRILSLVWCWGHGPVWVGLSDEGRCPGSLKTPPAWAKSSKLETVLGAGLVRPRVKGS